MIIYKSWKYLKNLFYLRENTLKKEEVIWGKQTLNLRSDWRSSRSERGSGLNSIYVCY